MLPTEQIHPVVVHFPIVFTLTLAAFDLAVLFRSGIIGGRDSVGNVSTGLAVCAGTFAAIAFAFGDVALDIALDKGTKLSVMETHEELGHVAAAVLVIWGIIRAILWWCKRQLSGKCAVSIVVLEIIIAALIITTAYFGGQLVYEFGVGVATDKYT
tara:strand:- start:210 stop:677 length:468 start_codon:yes stop_codon:yes gene_type:complete